MNAQPFPGSIRAVDSTRVTNRGAIAQILELHPFHTPTALFWSEVGYREVGAGGGGLYEHEAQPYRDAAAEIDYVVWSAYTPVAWHTLPGRWTTLGRPLITPTGNHQQIVNDALELLPSPKHWTTLPPLPGENATVSN